MEFRYFRLLLLDSRLFNISTFICILKIQIKSILDCDPIASDIVFCNGTLTYFSEQELPNVFDKFRKSKMICAIHNTTEDVEAAAINGDELTTCNKTRLIKPQNWWMDTFAKNGFNIKYVDHIRCFCAVPSRGA